jgi:hypothetical protein
MNKFSFIFLVSSLILTSCEKGGSNTSVDKENPIIEVFILSDENIPMKEGTSLSISLFFTDNDSLLAYRVRIEDNIIRVKPTFVPWNLQQDYSINGTSYSTSKTYQMPYPSEPGSYRVDVILQDAALNETEQSRFFTIDE